MAQPGETPPGEDTTMKTRRDTLLDTCDARSLTFSPCWEITLARWKQLGRRGVRPVLPSTVAGGVRRAGGTPCVGAGRTVW